MPPEPPRGPRDWRSRVSEDLDYYLDTERGRHELSEMVRAETERILEFIRTQRPRVRDIIWFSAHCRNCSFFDSQSRHARCAKHEARLVKPFFGRPVWVTVVDSHGDKQLTLSDIDWNAKAFDISDLVIEEATRRINQGLPYTCFEPAP
jgi:hypothetical protein